MTRGGIPHDSLQKRRLHRQHCSVAHVRATQGADVGARSVVIETDVVEVQTAGQHKMRAPRSSYSLPKAASKRENTPDHNIGMDLHWYGL